jgi:hypothetical protein
MTYPRPTSGRKRIPDSPEGVSSSAPEHAHLGQPIRSYNVRPYVHLPFRRSQSQQRMTRPQSFLLLPPKTVVRAQIQGIVSPL